MSQRFTRGGRKRAATRRSEGGRKARMQGARVPSAQTRPTARRRGGFLFTSSPPPTSFVHQMKTKRHDLLSAAISVTREFVLFEKCASDASLGETEERGLPLRGR